MLHEIIYFLTCFSSVVSPRSKREPGDADQVNI